jgi:hypothetical protein
LCPLKNENKKGIAMAHPNHTISDAVREFGVDEYDEIPKSVWATIAIYFASQVEGVDIANETIGLHNIRMRILQEWNFLYLNDIIKQRPLPYERMAAQNSE